MKYREFLEILDNSRSKKFCDTANNVTIHYYAFPKYPNVSLKISCGTSVEINQVSVPNDPDLKVSSYKRVMIDLGFGHSTDKKASLVARRICKKFSNICITTTKRNFYTNLWVVNHSIKIRQLYCIFSYIDQTMDIVNVWGD